MQLEIKVDIDRKIKPDPLRAISFALRALERDLEQGTGDAATAIRMGMRGRQRLYDPAGNTIGFADITD